MTPSSSYILRQISYSGLNELNACERKFVIDRLSIYPRSSSIDTAFGSAVGAGVQALWLSEGSLDAAILAIFKAWDVSFAEEKETTKKSIAHAVQAIHLYLPFYQILSQEWTLAEINGKPAIEFSLLVEFPGDFRYRAYADLLLQHKETGEIAVIELKTTGSNFEHEAMYKNSDQGTSYSLIVDQLSPDASYFFVKYFSYHSKSLEWIPYDFPKRLIDKVRWIKTVLLDISHIQAREAESYWPMRGNNCMSFGKPCRYFDVCGLPDAAVFSSEELLQGKMKEEQKKVYSFVVPLEQIIKGYLEK